MHIKSTPIHICDFVTLDTDKIVELMPELKRISSEIFRPAALSRSFQVVHGAPLVGLYYTTATL